MKITELQQRFAAADPAFGPVPMWWWSGEEVTEERIRWQMGKFRAGGLRNIGIINLAPTGPQYGSVSDRPAYLSEAWWALFEIALREAERLGMRLWFYDQIGFSGANLPARIVATHPECEGYQLRRFARGDAVPVSSNLLLETGDHVYAVVRQGFNWLDPHAAGLLIDRVHGEMERRFPHELGKTIAGSFQDELPPMPMWSPEIPVLYTERYNEDLIEVLPALFRSPYADDRVRVVRRRFYRLIAELAERAFFKPLGDWHRKYGMLIGFDQAGPARKADPHGAQRLYVDYFRTHRWFNAPGSDADGEIKPHSSMAHLHGGSRVWLEAFHSSGWGGTLEETMHWLVPWLQAGATLYNPHSNYFSTRGGWWEWAPPDTGWRQPYFEHYPVFADTVSRACYLLSQGVHVCDIAVHYPSYDICGHMSLDDAKPSDHPMVPANRDPDEHVTRIRDIYREITGFWNRREYTYPGALRGARMDFDIVDDAALHKALPEGGHLRIAEERFSVLLLCGTTVMDEEARRSVQSWIGGGGWVIAVAVPEQQRDLAGAVYVDTSEEAVRLIETRLRKRVEGPGHYLHRRTEDADVFLLLPRDEQLLVMHRPASPDATMCKPAVYRLRSNGEPKLWDPVSGSIEPLAYTRQGEWIELEVPFDSWPAALVVCSEEKAAATAGSAVVPAVIGADQELTLSDDIWTIRTVATLDNRYGDFDLHGGNSGLLPVERRHFLMKLEDGKPGEEEGWHNPDADCADWTPRLWSESAYWIACKGEQFRADHANPVVYSSIFGDLSMRTWAGRMGHIPRRFLNLGELEPDESAWARTYVIAPSAGRYWIRVESGAEIDVWINGKEVGLNGGPEEQTAWIDLNLGHNELKLKARSIKRGSVRVGVEINPEARPELPKWLFTHNPNPKSSLKKLIESRPNAPVERVRIIFAARGRAMLYVNGYKVTEHGDFNPYVRQGQEEVDVTAHWRPGENEIKFLLPEGKGEVFADGIVECRNGEVYSFCTGPDWIDEQGDSAGVLHGATLRYTDTESLWVSARPHPLPGVSWLMPESAPEPKPLSFVADPALIGKPVWLRFPLPIGATAMRIESAGAARLWIGGAEAPVVNGRAQFPPQRAGTVAAVKIVPDGVDTEAAVLKAPIRFETAPMQGPLGDWRTALHLPHHSGAVEYEAYVDLPVLKDAVLDLGFVRGTVEAWLDGKPLGVRIWSPYRFSLGPDTVAGTYRLRIRVTNTLGAHYEIGRPTSLVGANPDVAYWSKDRPEEAEWQTQFAAGGLFGPVRILSAGSVGGR
ncbi:glycosyl hydrolase family 2 protein [Paenibacillus alkalitolerans]|uniref:hypothetical protein n=1 Tax=Paenibacillus alkalitolerans TaxID=2799335 RepID=UPI001F26CC9A|nr:hypothetical protein [Paenibacillus alkalitolerans]